MSSVSELIVMLPFWVFGTYSKPCLVMHCATSSSVLRFCSL